MTVALESVCTHDQIVEEIGSHKQLGQLLPSERNGSTELDRRIALRDVLAALAKRTPPVTEDLIANPADLTRAVTYATCARLYRMGIVEVGDAFAVRFKHFTKLLEDEIETMPITSTGGSQINPAAIAVFRR